MHIKFPSLVKPTYRYAKELLGELFIVTEKIDGANASVWWENGIRCGSRNLEIDSGFRGFVEYARSHRGINKLLAEYPQVRLYGEWLVKHSVNYRPESYSQFYLFSVLDEANGRWLSWMDVKMLATQYYLKTPYEFHTSATFEEACQFAGKSALGDEGEGVVLTVNPNFSDKGCDLKIKVVTDKFRESNKVPAMKMPKPVNRDFGAQVESHVTRPRVFKKVMEVTGHGERAAEKSDTGKIISLVSQDIVNEEMGDHTLAEVQRVAAPAIVRVFHDILKENG